MSGPVRYASYGIDTVLLTAALMLVTILPAAMFANHWLTLKVALLVVYVVLGTLALKRAATPQGAMALLRRGARGLRDHVGIARAHHPWGGWRLGRLISLSA